MSNAFSQFIITDGDTVLDLLELNNYGFGIGIEEYTPGRPQLKGGGVWQDSPFATGRQLAYSVKDNVSDVVTLQFSYRSHNEIIQAQELLDLMIEKAIAYWGQDWQSTPVYIKAQARGETAARYALIYNITIDKYHDPFHEPFAKGAPPYMASGIVLGIERSVWMENAPGTGTALEFYHEKHTDEATAGVVVSNYRNSGLTHIYRHSGSFGSNMLSASLPYDLFSATVAVGSIIYFGSPYPFFGLTFDLSTAMSATTWTLVFEYSTSGATWTALNFIDDGDGEFNQTGVTRMSWGQLDDFGAMAMDAAELGTAWTKETVNSVTQYWVRIRISASSGTITPPRQQTRQPYAIAVPYAKVNSDQVDGTLDALLDLYLQSFTYNQGVNVETLLLGLRSVDRGDDFTAYINATTATNPTGVSISSGNNMSTVTTYQSPIGSLLRFTAPAGPVLDARVIIGFANSIAADYYGRFRLFARINYTDTTGVSLIRYRLVNSDTDQTMYTGSTKALPATPTNYTFYLADLGYIQMPPSSQIRQDENVGGFEIQIDAYTLETKVVDFIDFFLLPVDEWSATITGGDNSTSNFPNIEIDSIGYPKFSIRGLQKNAAGSQIGKVLGVSSNSEAILHANTVQALWAIRKYGNAAHLLMNDLISGYRQQRYHNLRSA